MAFTGEFTVDVKYSTESIMRDIRPKLKEALKEMYAEVYKEFVGKFVDKWVDNTRLVKYLRSQTGLGFMGVQSPKMEAEIAKMKDLLTKSLAIHTYDRGFTVNFGESDILAASLVLVVNRFNTEDGVGFYRWVEPWFKMITEGFSGDQKYRVVYKAGFGESRFAKMIGPKSDKKLYRRGRENAVQKLENPIIEVWEDHGKQITASLERSFKRHIKEELARRI